MTNSFAPSTHEKRVEAKAQGAVGRLGWPAVLFVKGKVPGEEPRPRENIFRITAKERQGVPSRFDLDQDLNRTFGAGKVKPTIYNPFGGFRHETIRGT